MNCPAFQEQLCRMLDGSAPEDRAAFDQHLRDCADCRASFDASRRLQTGLRQLRAPAPPDGLTARLVAAVLEDRRLLLRRARRRLVLVAVAASVLIAVAVRFWPTHPAVPPVKPEVAREKIDRPRELSHEEARPTPRDTVESAVGAMASLTTRTTTRTVEETRKLMPLVEPALPDLSWQPALPSVSFSATGHGVSEGLEPMANHAKRAVDLLRRDLLNQN